MIGNVLHIQRPFGIRTEKIADGLCKSLNVAKKPSSRKEYTILESSDMIVAIRKRMIDIVLLKDFDHQEKERIFQIVEKR